MSIPPHPQEPGFVYVPVPVGKVEAVFRLLSGSGGHEGPDMADHLRSLRRVYLESEEQFRALLRFLAERPGESISTSEIAEGLGLPNGAASLAGMLGAYARRSKNRYEGYWPFERLYNPIDDRAELMMEDNVAEIVNRLEPDSRRPNEPV